ncbi:MAG: thioredoxin family protein [Actinomycetia bacterium]|nr:thioredoxin family protein [Actinomycetes bacterium]
MDNVGPIVLVAVLAAATGFGLWRRRTDGRLRPVPSAAASAAASAEPWPVFPASDVGIALGQRASLVQFSTAFCQPCRATRMVLSEVADMVDGVVACEVDAEAHLDLVRQWGVMRTPTVFMLDASGLVRQPAVGQPRKADVIAAIGALIEPSTPARPVREI